MTFECESVAVQINPSLRDACTFSSSILAKRNLLIVVGDCLVEYEGRSSSTLGWGERVMMVKADRAVLIHRRTGYEPVNWQPPGCIISVSDSDGMLIRALRRAPREILSVRYRQVLLVMGLRLIDDAKFEMLLTERELYDAILSDPGLIEPGFRVSSFQKDTKLGVMDLTGVDANGCYVVVEVKKDRADVEAVRQVYRYVSDSRKTAPNIRGIIASPGIKVNARRLLKSLGLEYRHLDLNKCNAVLAQKRSAPLESLDKHLR